MNFYSNYLMEKLNLKDSTNETTPTTKDDNNQANQLESPLTDKYDSAAESQASDQSDQDNARMVNGSESIGKQSSSSNNDLNSKIVNLSISDTSSSNHSQFRNKSNSLQENARFDKQSNGGVKQATNQPTKQVQGRRSDNEILVEQTKERMKTKFDLLEKETGVKLKKSGLNFDKNSQETSSTLSSNNGSLRTNDLNDHSSPEVGDYANSVHDSESVSSFEIKHQTMSAEQIKEQAGIRLEFELRKAQKELKLRDEEIAKLSRIRKEVELELEDLTASLFEEANKMVQDAKHEKSKSDKALKEATMKNDVLQAEVKALKVLVRNSIPSPPSNSASRQGSFKATRSTSSSQNNNSLDIIKNQFAPKLIKSPKNSIRAIINRTSIPFHSKTSKTNVGKLMKSEKRSCKKSPSNFELASEMSRFGEQPDEHTSRLEQVKEETTQCINELKKFGEIDPIYYEEFLEWHKKPVLNKEGSFMKRIYDEEIETTMNFKNQKLTIIVLEAIKQNNIIIELNTEKSNFQKKCALLDIPRICNYRMKINDEWYNISQLCRDRTSACCDLFCYLRYIQQGLVKSGVTEVYWEICRRRRNLILSKLGFSAL